MRNNKIVKFIKNHFFITVFLIFYSLILLYKLILHPVPFYDWDESIYAQVGKEMIEKPSIVPLWQGKFWLDKPPLVPLFYGAVLKIFFFVSPEISTRIFNLLLTVITLFFIYLVYLKVIKGKLITTAIVALTAFTPIFIQRAQVLNIDVFVLLGWLGYILFFENYLLSLLFLAIAVFSKSLIGFYPSAIISLFYLYLFFTKKIDKKKIKTIFIKIFTQVAVLSIWYILMFVFFGKAFWQQHIIESHFKRVTASIESHFGKRTYYVDLIINQFGNYFWFSLLGLSFVLFLFFKRKIDATKLLYVTYLLPWFIFLNLTKTKIFWYIYPIIPQFSFLTLFPITFFKKIRFIYYSILIILLAVILNNGIIKNNFFQSYYSSYDEVYSLSTYAKNQCNSLHVLVDKDSRQAAETLESMNLLITTSKWWGNHPAIVYYFGKKTEFIYNKEKLIKTVNIYKNNDCIALYKNDLNFNVKEFKNIKQFNQLYLFKK